MSPAVEEEHRGAGERLEDAPDGPAATVGVSTPDL